MCRSLEFRDKSLKTLKFCPKDQRKRKNKECVLVAESDCNSQNTQFDFVMFSFVKPSILKKKMCSLKLSKSEAVFVNAEKFILGISIVFQDIGYSEITRPDEISPKLSVLSQKTQVIVLN